MMPTRACTLTFLCVFSTTHGFLFWSSSDTSPVNCTATQRRCNDGVCLDVSRWCDGEQHCSNGEDEIDCQLHASIECLDTVRWFQCTNKHCVQKSFVCDGIDDCDDLSDEADCPTEDFEPKNCSVTELACDNDTSCIPHDWLCDGNIDCYDETDERNCTCSPDLYQCPDSDRLVCIPHYYRCDGKPDCDNAADETDPLCVVRSVCASNEGLTMCRDGQQCIDVGRSCDGKADCSDRSDELNCTACSTMSCQQGCIPHPGGATRCTCQSGYFLHTDKKQCIDVDECAKQQTSKPICSQDCENTKGSFLCQCVDGYQLDKDGQRCKAIGREATLILANSTQIRTFSLGMSLYNLLQEGFQEVIDIAVDSHDMRVFWTDGHTHEVRSININGNNYKNLVAHGLDSPHGLSYDWLNKLLYIVDAGKKSILACQADGAHCTIVCDNLEEPRDIVVDPISSYLYWTDLSNDPAILRSDSDGQNRMTLVDERIGQPKDLVMDYTTNCLYWIDTQIHNNRIERLCFQRKQENEIVLAHEIHDPSSLTIFEDEIYWSNRGRVVRGNKFNGMKRETVVKEMLGVTTLDIMHPALQPRPHDYRVACRGSCSHICLPSRQYSFVCACPTDLKLGPDGTHCVNDDNATHILIGQQTKILEFSVGHLGNEAYENIDINYIHSIYLLDYDPVNKSIVFTDKDSQYRPIICSARIVEGSQIRKVVLIDKDISSIEGLAVDWVARNVFWVDSVKRTIEVARLDGSSRAIVTDQALMEPHGLAVYPEDGLLFYADWGDSPHIQRCDMDATNCFLVVHERIRQPNCLTIDADSDRLYWSDMKLNEIFSVFIDGSDRSSPIFASHVKSIVVEGTLIYWTDGQTDAVHMIDSSTRNNKETSYHSGHRGLTGMTLINRRKSKPVDNGCSSNNGGCSHICLAKEEGATCRCPANLTLRFDGKTCYDKLCSVGEILCAQLGLCLPNTTRCDGTRDCPDHSDEDECPVTCSSDQYQCVDKTCIADDWKCDGDKDCPDGADEKNCPPIPECSKDEFKCDERRCISQSDICNGIEDCTDATDEEHCERCTSDKFRCDDGKCIGHAWVCDGDSDCRHGEDEIDCKNVTCSPTQFTCNDGRCIEINNKCDGITDCVDGSDEAENCNECTGSEFMCASSNGSPKCLSQSVRCNGYLDCPLGDDERNCPLVCSDGEYKCGSENLCIPSSQVCDLNSDCPDNSDESPELCGIAECAVAMFKCRSGECIPQKLRCDRKPDCPDGSDETELCGKSCEYARLGCSHNCTMTTMGAQCVCREGYYLETDDRSCFDINECEHTNGVCGQICENKKGGYSCECAEGYQLAIDEHTCKATGERPYLLVANRHGISKINLATKSEEFTIVTETLPIFIDTLIRHDRKLIYWSTQETRNDQNVSTIKMYTAAAPQTFLTTSGKVTGLAVDWLAMNLYYTQNLSGGGVISVCLVQDGSTCKTLMLRERWTPSFITLHPTKGLMFWMSNNDGRMTISRSCMDGQDIVDIVTSSLYRPVGLTVDPVTDRIYWVDNTQDAIRMATIEGRENVTILRRKLSEPFTLDFFENSLYLSQRWSVVEFARFKETNGKEPITVQEILRPMGMKIVHAIRQMAPSDSTNPCASLGCGQLCLLMADQQARCECMDGMKHNSSDERHCVPIAMTEEHVSQEPAKMMECLNGGIHEKNSTWGWYCSCPAGYTGFHCEVSLVAVVEDNKVWVVGLVLGILLIAACIGSIAYFIRTRRKSIDLVSIIKFRNPAFKSKKDEETEELVTEIAFGNPGFQDFDEIPDQDWLSKLVASTSQMSVDSAFASRQGSFVHAENVNEN